jgi:siroheme synthase (precorrin-2 oxidase/ferrochelatase)
MADLQNKNYLPLLLDVTEKKILMIGAGLACREKLRTLSLSGKSVTVISSSFHEDFLNKNWITREERRYRKGDLLGYDIVYVGINNPEVSVQIQSEVAAIREGDSGFFREIRPLMDEYSDSLLKRNILINFVDKPLVSDFISPAVLIKKYFAVFISTFGRGPGMTKKIRQTLEEKIDLDALDEEARIYIENRPKKGLPDPGTFH